jgi:hypothetical protein
MVELHDARQSGVVPADPGHSPFETENAEKVHR